MINSIIAVFVGSGIGGICRWFIAQWMNGQYPFGTLLVNVIGCFLLGWLTKLAPGDTHLKLLLMTGFCGGFTTFSTFVNENVLMMRGSQFLLSMGYILLSLALGLLASWLGYRI